GSLGGVDQLLITAVARAIGVDPVRINYVPFSGGGEAAQALLSHEVLAAVSGYAELAPYIAAGRIQPLAISAERRLPGVPIPTLREKGIDVTLINWRGVFAPPGITEQQRSRLAGMVDAMSRTGGWRKTLEESHWTDLYLAGPAFARFVGEETARSASGPDPRGAAPTDRPGVVWTRNMRILRNRNLLVSLIVGAGLLAAGLIVWQRAAAARRERELFRNLEAARQD